MGFTTSYWLEERWSRRVGDTLTSYGRCWNHSFGNWDVNWRVGWNVSGEDDRCPSSERIVAFSRSRTVRKRTVIFMDSSTRNERGVVCLGKEHRNHPSLIWKSKSAQ